MMKKVKIPQGVDVSVEGKKVSVKGPMGEIKKDFGNPAFNHTFKIDKDNDEITVSTEDEKRKIKAMVGTVCAIIGNMIKGVRKGYEYTLKIYFVHFPVTVESKETEKGVEISVKNFLGERKPRKAVLKHVKVKISGDTIKVMGIDKEKAGQAAARLEQITKVRKKDRRWFNDGIFITGNGLVENEEEA